MNCVVWYRLLKIPPEINPLAKGAITAGGNNPDVMQGLLRIRFFLKALEIPKAPIVRGLARKPDR